MEYLWFDYKNVNKQIAFSNYDNFITNNKNFKYYAFDLFLSRYDMELKKGNKPEKYVKIQKTLFIIPYILVSFILISKYRNGFFIRNDFEGISKESKYIFKLFCGVMIYRVIQKGILKYMGDDLFVPDKN